MLLPTLLPKVDWCTQNHAFNVHRSTLHYLSVLSETCASLLQRAHPLHTIFGPYCQPEKLAEQCYRRPSPLPIHANVTSSPVAIRMERRRYVSDPGLRAELVKLYNVRFVFPAKQLEKKYA